MDTQAKDPRSKPPEIPTSPQVPTVPEPTAAKDTAPENMEVLEDFHPAVRRWFAGRFPQGPSAPQATGWPAIRRREDTLIAAPTGTGKTLAAFLVCIDSFFCRAGSGARTGCGGKEGAGDGEWGGPRFS